MIILISHYDYYIDNGKPGLKIFNKDGINDE